VTELSLRMPVLGAKVGDSNALLPSGELINRLFDAIVYTNAPPQNVHNIGAVGGGLTSSTLLSLYPVPVIFLALARARGRSGKVVP
jgi:hypothetical protein